MKYSSRQAVWDGDMSAVWYSPAILGLGAIECDADVEGKSGQ